MGSLMSSVLHTAGTKGENCFQRNKKRAELSRVNQSGSGVDSSIKLEHLASLCETLREAETLCGVNEFLYFFLRWKKLAKERFLKGFKLSSGNGPEEPLEVFSSFSSFRSG